MGSSGTPLPVATSTEMGTDQSAVRLWENSDLTADWSVPISMLVWVRTLMNQMFWEQCAVR